MSENLEQPTEQDKLGYNYDSFVGRSYSFPNFKSLLKVGTRAPDFKANLLDGSEITLSSHFGNENVVLEFGSMTCPPAVFNSAASPVSLNKLYPDYKDKGFQFYVVYTREAHPGENVPHHKSYDQKLSQATRFKTEEDLQVPIIVDSLEGDIHHKYGLLPNMIYVINKQGLIVYKADWTNMDEMRSVLDDVLKIEKARSSGESVRISYSERLSTYIDVNESIRLRVMERAGEKAQRDWDKASASWRRPSQP